LTALGALAILPSTQSRESPHEFKNICRTRGAGKDTQSPGASAQFFNLEELSQRKRFVSEPAEMVEADGSTVSRHLALLKNAGNVQGWKRGTQVFYSLRVACVLNSFPALSRFWNLSPRNSRPRPNDRRSCAHFLRLSSVVRSISCKSTGGANKILPYSVGTASGAVLAVVTAAVTGKVCGGIFR